MKTMTLLLLAAAAVIIEPIMRKAKPASAQALPPLPVYQGVINPNADMWRDLAGQPIITDTRAVLQFGNTSNAGNITPSGEFINGF